MWPLYDQLRTARLNKKVLGCEIRRLDRRIKVTEATVALSTSSSVGGFWVFQNVFGAVLWKTLGAVAVVLTLVKPIFRFAPEKSAREALLIGYGLLENDLLLIATEAQTRGRYDDDLMRQFKRALGRKEDLIKAGLGTMISRKQIEALEEEVDQELPSESFYFPP